MNYDLQRAKLISSADRKEILEKQYIKDAGDYLYSYESGTPFHFLFEVYADSIDIAKEVSDWQCPKCRHTVLSHFRMMEPYLFLLEKSNYLVL